ncbi:MAG: LAGLIDADG family homing endonuclease [Candidatus Andersenbacteria bacterium]
MNYLSATDRAYIAGFLDGDGSIYVQLKPNKTYRFQYQVAPNIVFFQAKKEREVLEQLHQLLGVGYLRDRKDGIVEFIIGDVLSMELLLIAALPYLRFKQRQAEVMLQILRVKQSVKTGEDFLELCSLIDQFKILNYSKRRSHTRETVQQTLSAEGLLTP